MLYPAARNLLPIWVKGGPGFNSLVSSGIIYPKDPVYKYVFECFNLHYYQKEQKLQIESLDFDCLKLEAAVPWCSTKTLALKTSQNWQKNT